MALQIFTFLTEIKFFFRLSFLDTILDKMLFRTFLKISSGSCRDSSVLIRGIIFSSNIKSKEIRFPCINP